MIPDDARSALGRETELTEDEQRELDRILSALLLPTFTPREREIAGAAVRATLRAAKVGVGFVVDRAREEAFKAGWRVGYYDGGEHDCRMFTPTAERAWDDYRSTKR